VSATPDDCFHLSITSFATFAEALVICGLKAFVTKTCSRPRSGSAPSFGGKSPYLDIVEVAAAYLFYVCRNHPFLDGNKRTAMMAAIVFLRLNGIEPKATTNAGSN
jgi:hypothetical protein